MAEESYEIVEAYIPRYLGNNRLEFANKRLNENVVYRGLANGWERFSTSEFTAFAKENGIVQNTEIVIAREGPNTFSVIHTINF